MPKVVIDPWGSELPEDYGKIIKQFGLDEFDAGELPRPNALMRHGGVFAGRDIGRIAYCIKNKKPFYCLTGIMPSAPQIHFGTKSVIDNVRYFQDNGAKTYVLVADLEAARRFFQENFQLQPSESESFGELDFSFAPIEGTALEFLQSTTDQGVISKFIQKKGQGVHHITFEVDDIQAELDRLKQNGLTLINEQPYRNAHDELVAFIHPKSTYGILIELLQT